MLMPDKPRTPVIIAGLVGFAIVAVGAFYYHVLAMIPGGGALRFVVLIGTVLVLSALVYVVRQRLREMKEEDPDDYRKY